MAIFVVRKWGLLYLQADAVWCICGALLGKLAARLFPCQPEILLLALFPVYGEIKRHGALPVDETHRRSLKPGGVIMIGSLAFFLCKNLTSISIPDSVTTIGDGTFDSCDNLSSIIIGKSITLICDNAFSFCKRRRMDAVCQAICRHDCWTESLFDSCFLAKGLYPPTKFVDFLFVKGMLCFAVYHLHDIGDMRSISSKKSHIEEF